VDGSVINLALTSAQTSVADVCNFLTKTWKLPESFGLDHGYFAGEEEFRVEALLEKQRILDVHYSALETIPAVEAGRKNKSNKEPADHQFVFTVRTFFASDLAELTPANIHYYYIQAHQDVLRQRYQTTDEEALIYGALAIQSHFGPDSTPPDNILITAGKRFLPDRLLQRYASNMQQLKNLVVGTELAKVRTLPPAEAKRRYLDTVKTNRYYGCHFFTVVEQTGTKKEEIIFVVGERGLQFMNPMSRAPSKKQMKLDELVEVEAKGDTVFQFSAGQLLNKRTYTFETRQAATIRELVQHYIDSQSEG